jgi:hypothetical protein
MFVTNAFAKDDVWQIVHFPLGNGAVVSAGKGIHFGFRCFDQPDNMMVFGDTAYIFRFEGRGNQCLERPGGNVVVESDGKTYNYDFDCDSESGALSFKLAGTSRAHLSQLQYLDKVIDSNRSGYINVTIADANLFRTHFSLKNAHVRKKMVGACTPNHSKKK